jgi:hypothetical protein
MIFLQITSKTILVAQCYSKTIFFKGTTTLINQEYLLVVCILFLKNLTPKVFIHVDIQPH